MSRSTESYPQGWYVAVAAAKVTGMWGELRELWRELWLGLANLMLPVSCAGCGRPRVGGPLCGACARLLDGAVPHRVWPSPLPALLPSVYGALAYADEVRAVLLAHKERGALRLAGPLGAVLAGVVREVVQEESAWPRAGPGGGGAHAVPDRVTLVPVPSARRAVAARGHDPVRRMALVAARRLRKDGIPVRVLSALRQRRRVADQSGLSAEQRLANLGGALEPRPGAARLLGPGLTVLVDDLMTTGASLAEAARAVAEEGHGAVGAAVVAFGRRG